MGRPATTLEQRALAAYHRTAGSNLTASARQMEVNGRVFVFIHQKYERVLTTYLLQKCGQLRRHQKTPKYLLAAWATRERPGRRKKEEFVEPTPNESDMHTHNALVETETPSETDIPTHNTLVESNIPSHITLVEDDSPPETDIPAHNALVEDPPTVKKKRRTRIERAASTVTPQEGKLPSGTPRPGRRG